MFGVSDTENICCIADMELHCPQISVQSVDIHVCIVSLFCGSTSVEPTLIDVVVVLMV